VKAPYVFDTNSVSVLRNYYPDQFPSFWKRFHAAVSAGEVISCREVLHELKGLQKGWLLEWAEAKKAMFRMPSDDETNVVGEIFRVAHFRALVGQEQQLKGTPVADPFVVAAARVFGGCVVTEEALKPNAAKIPNVCEHFGIDCTNLEGFLKYNEWTF